MKKQLWLSGLGACLVDILAQIDEETLTDLGFEKGTMTFTGTDEQKKLLDYLANKGQTPEKLERVSGGSVANTMYNFAKICSAKICSAKILQQDGDAKKGAFYGSIGKDSNGDFYKQEFETAGIEFVVPLKEGQMTGACVSLITPDTERTMRTSLCASADFRVEDLANDAIERSEWFFIEGYSFVNFPQCMPVLTELFKRAKLSGTKTALTASEPWVISAKREDFLSVLNKLDLLFTNEHEAKEITGCKSIEEAITVMREKVANFVITLGSEGAVAYMNGEFAKVPAEKVQTVDLTGAGDTFASGFFYNLMQGQSLEECLKLGCELAGKVVSKVGARLA